MPVEVQVTVDAVDVAGEVASLRAWLNDEPGLRGRVSVVPPARSADDMGALSDTVLIVLSSSGAVAGLAGVLKTWLQHRSVDITVTVKGKTGERSVQVSASRAKDAERILQVLNDADDDDDADADDADADDER